MCLGRSLSQKTLQRIGSHYSPLSGRYTAPGISTLHYIFKKAKVEQAEKILAAWMAEQVDVDAIAMDGKTMRGSYNRDLDAHGKQRDEPARQQLSTVDLKSRAVVGQVGYSGKKDEAEGAALREELEPLEPGTTVLADALHTSRETGQRIEDLGLYYIFQAKGNQPNMFQTLSEYSWPNPELREVDMGHGRIETRWVTCSAEIDADLAEPWLDFPGVRFAVRVRRRAVFKKTGEQREETAYYITNLPPKLIARKKLSYLIRRYWGAVENGVHYVRDVALGRGCVPCAHRGAAAHDGGHGESGHLDPAAAGSREHQAHHQPAAAQGEGHRDSAGTAGLNGRRHSKSRSGS
ncbi:MAG: ISAs1 family transposase [Bryobacterales bacterium]|nr:ISAs1 family transposase [Bryobacterales bacterium]